MNKIFYDLHIHSCLSPCGEMDMTPFNIAGMAKVKELDLIALCDHNTCKNCGAFLKACDNYNIIGICGMELTTAEEIHLICLFKSLKTAVDFSEKIEKHRMKIKNKADIFGFQAIVNDKDEIVNYDEYLLPIATMLGLEEAYNLVLQHGGKCFPAHINKQSNSIISILGQIPNYPAFKAVEINDKEKISLIKKNYFNINEYTVFTNSDAHYLWDINERENYFLSKSNRKEDIINTLFDLM
ncbi:MAG: phosphoesterase [Oscillospiraceae bacterium]